MAKRILLIRMLGAGDVLAIGVPALRHLQAKFPHADITVLTFGRGVEIIKLAEPNVEVMQLAETQWPDDLLAAMEIFLSLAEQVVARGFDQVINLDTAFMPCFLARFLKDAGEPVNGNYINKSVQQLLGEFQTQELQPEYVQSEAHYMQSSFFTMSAWQPRWWESVTAPDGGYAEYYLRNCCAFSPFELDMQLNVVAAFAPSTDKKRIVLALHQSDDGYLYPHTDTLQTTLQQAGFEVILQSGYESVKQMAEQIKGSDLVITKSAASRWFSMAVGTPVLLVAGTMEPRNLMPDYATEPTSPCPVHGPQQGLGVSKLCNCDKVEELVDGVVSIFEEAS